MRSHPVLLHGCAALVLLVFSADARAQSEAGAIERGHEALLASRCAEAASIFAEILETTESPRARAELGLARACTSAWVEAERDLEAALARSDAWVDSNRSVLQQNLDRARARLATLVVEVSGPAVATVRVDGAPRGSAGEHLRVVAGTLVVEVVADGYEVARRRIDVAAGTRARERFVLVAASSRSSAGVDPLPILGWVGVGLAGVAAIGGVVATAVREDAIATYNDDARCDRDPTVPRSRECSGHLDRSENAETWMIVSFTASGVLAAASITALLISAGGDEDAARRARVSCGPALGGAGVICRGWF